MKNMAKKTILIIEDQQSLARALRDRLDREGYEVKVCFEGEEGYESIISLRPDLVLLDLLLPKLFGLELLAMVRQHDDKSVRDVPVIVLTNYPEKEYFKRVEELGCKEFLIKSNYSIDEIIKIIKKYI